MLVNWLSYNNTFLLQIYSNAFYLKNNTILIHFDYINVKKYRRRYPLLYSNDKLAIDPTDGKCFKYCEDEDNCASTKEVN